MSKGRGGGKTPIKVIELLAADVAKSSIRATARQLTLTQSAIHRYLKGVGEPSQATLQKLADYFGVSVAYLRGEDSYSYKTPENTVEWLWAEVKLKGLSVIAESTGIPATEIERYMIGLGIPSDDACKKFAVYSGKDELWFKGIGLRKNIAAIGPDHSYIVEREGIYNFFEVLDSMLPMVDLGVSLALKEDLSNNENAFFLAYLMSYAVRRSPIGLETQCLGDNEVYEIWSKAGEFFVKYESLISQHNLGSDPVSSVEEYDFSVITVLDKKNIVKNSKSGRDKKI